MNIYRGKSSSYVRIATISAVILSLLILFTIILLNKSLGITVRVILPLLIVGAIIYLYSISLNKIIIEKDSIVLKKNIGKIKIPNTDILDVCIMSYSNLTMTYGSKGVFGFIGNTMDDSVSLVKDRNQMFRITTKDKKYLLSSENSEELVGKMKVLYELQ
ncbi:MAG: PH domain-containing protein [Gelidibacter sp.]